MSLHLEMTLTVGDPLNLKKQVFMVNCYKEVMFRNLECLLKVHECPEGRVKFCLCSSHSLYKVI